MNNTVRRIIYVPTNDQLTGELVNYEKYPYEGAIHAFNKDYTIRYDGKSLSVSNDKETLFKNFGTNSLITIMIDNTENLSAKLDVFVCPTLKKNPWAFLWYTDCWTKDRLTASKKTFENMVEKGGENSVVLGSKGISLLYYKNDHGGFYRKKALLKDPILIGEDVKTLCKKIIDLKKDDGEHIGWNCDYISSVDNAKYDLLYEAPYTSIFDQDTSIRKELYRKFMEYDRCNYTYDGTKRLENLKYKED